MLRRTASSDVDAGAPVDQPAVLAAAQGHARMRMDQGLGASDIVTEFRLLRQEIGWAMRSDLADTAPTTDVLGAEMLLHDALDAAAFLAVGKHEAELQRLREALAIEQVRLAALLEQMPAAVIMAEAPSGQVALGHPHVQRLALGPGVPVPAGENPNEWQGYYRDGRRYTPEDWPLARAVRTGEAVTGEEIDYLRADGSRGTVSVNAAPIRDQAGAVVAGVAIFSDVTERKTLEQEKEAFLAAISHDLRNPLTAIKVTADLLQRQAGRGSVPHERLLECLRRITDAADRLDRQLTELQDIAGLRTGQVLELQRRRVDLVTLVQDAAARHQVTSQDHEVVVSVVGLAEPDLFGDWDEARLDRVLDNLLGNALKFSPQGGRITLALSREPAKTDMPAPSMAVLRVSDEGIGIPADDLPLVFDWFRRASNAAGKIAGTGIGLAAARQIMELHGGTIGADSQEGRGCTFTLRLPIGATASTPAS